MQKTGRRTWSKVSPWLKMVSFSFSFSYFFYLSLYTGVLVFCQYFLKKASKVYSLFKLLIYTKTSLVHVLSFQVSPYYIYIYILAAHLSLLSSLSVSLSAAKFVGHFPRSFSSFALTPSRFNEGQVLYYIMGIV